MTRRDYDRTAAASLSAAMASVDDNMHPSKLASGLLDQWQKAGMKGQ